MFKHRLSVASLLLMILMSATGFAQSFVLDLPRQSQRAVVTQRVGITDITVSYHRPLVNNRKVWDGLVPYGQVWRAGANENTTIKFSTPVSIEGQALDQGTYGLHMIPTADQWTIIFSKNSTSWGSFTYDQKEDALRVTVKPQSSDMHEALAYDFDDVKPTSAVVTLRWEKVAVPFKVEAKTDELVEASLQKQLRGLAQYTWMSWDDAANYLLAAKVDLPQALKYSDLSIQNEDRFDNEITKSKVLAAMNRKDDSVAAEKQGTSSGQPAASSSFCPRPARGKAQRRSVCDLPREREEASGPVVRTFRDGANLFFAGKVRRRREGDESGAGGRSGQSEGLRGRPGEEAGVEAGH